MKHPKHLTFSNKAYLDYIRKQDCCILGCPHKNARIEPHHIYNRFNDVASCPLCAVCHTLLHASTIKEFEREHDVNLHEQVLYYLLNYKGFNLG